MKQKKEHRIYRVSYSQKRDAFESFFYVGEKQYPNWEDFSFEASSKCFPAWIEEEHQPTEDACMVSYTVITRIRQALKLGYKLEFCDKPED
jgi:hypothetical protein